MKDLASTLAVISFALGGVAIIFKFTLDTLSDRLKSIESTWKETSRRMEISVGGIGRKVDIHVRTTNEQLERVREALRGCPCFRSPDGTVNG